MKRITQYELGRPASHALSDHGKTVAAHVLLDYRPLHFRITDETSLPSVMESVCMSQAKIATSNKF